VGNVSPGCDSSAAYGQQKPAGMSKFIPFRCNLDKNCYEAIFSGSSVLFRGTRETICLVIGVTSSIFC
jgi:hypothetical protein